MPLPEIDLQKKKKREINSLIEQFEAKLNPRKNI